MFYGLDDKNNKVCIDDAVKTNKYYCLECGEELILKKGAIKVHHFAHKSTENCLYSNREMSAWHLEWQSHFDKKQCEVICRSKDEVYIADVLLNNTVIEFQHSPISYYDVEDRTLFHVGCGRKIIWLFDFRHKYNNAIKERNNCSFDYFVACTKFNMQDSERENLFNWDRPNESITAIYYYSEEEPSYLFLQLDDDLIIHVDWNLRDEEKDDASFEYFSGDKLTKEEFLERVQQISRE